MEKIKRVNEFLGFSDKEKQLKKAIEEINKFDFKKLYYLDSWGERPNDARNNHIRERLEHAALNMPNVKILAPDLFKMNPSLSYQTFKVEDNTYYYPKSFMFLFRNKLLTNEEYAKIFINKLNDFVNKKNIYAFN